MKEIDSNIEVLGKYINRRTKIKVKCKKCKNEWETTPGLLLDGHTSCKLCIGKVKTHEVFIKELKQINPNIEVLSKYQKSSIKIKCKCKICGHEWEAIPSNLLRKRSCPSCKMTHGEKRVALWLKNNKIKYEIQYKFSSCKDIRLLLKRF